jgi:hypothetical protein
MKRIVDCDFRKMCMALADVSCEQFIFGSLARGHSEPGDVDVFFLVEFNKQKNAMECLSRVRLNFPIVSFNLNSYRRSITERGFGYHVVLGDESLKNRILAFEKNAA